METCKLDSPSRCLKKSLSYLPETPDHVLLNFSLAKEIKEAWGIIIVGGTKSRSGNVYIKKIVVDSVCDVDGHLKVGDNILEVNGECLKNKSHEEAVDVFHRSQTELNIIVSRLVEKKSKTDNPVLCSFQSSVKQRYISSSFDEEPDILEHKPLPVPKNYFYKFR